MLYTKFTVALFGLCLLFTNIAHSEPFGSGEKKSRNIENFPKWVEMLERLQEEEALCAKNNNCKLNNVANHLRKSLRSNNKFSILDAVNEYANSIKYVKDSDGWNKSDYWQTPEQFFEKGGDCEDYAIAKFSLLKIMGFKNEDMRIVVLKDTFKNVIHSVLVVNIQGRQYMLDNNIPKVVLASDVRQYKPIYSINETNWWKGQI